MLPVSCGQTFFGPAAVRHPPIDISRARACPTIRQPFSVRGPDGKLIAPVGDEFRRITSREVADPQSTVAPDVANASCRPSGEICGVSYERPGAFTGSAFPVRSNQTGFRSSKFILPGRRLRRRSPTPVRRRRASARVHYGPSSDTAGPLPDGACRTSSISRRTLPASCNRWRCSFRRQRRSKPRMAGGVWRGKRSH